MNLLWCPRGRERGLTEPLQISGLAKLALIPLWSFHPGQERREGLLFYSLTPQAKQRATRNWDNSTHGGSGAVILNVIFTEATREFLWATAKSQQHGGRGERSEEKRDIVLFPCDSLYFTSPEYSSFLPSLGRFFFFIISILLVVDTSHHIVLGNDWCEKNKIDLDFVAQFRVS